MRPRCIRYSIADMRSWGAKRSGTYPINSGQPDTVPLVGRDRPASNRSNVDFPEPFAPAIATTSPGGISRSTSWSTHLPRA